MEPETRYEISERDRRDLAALADGQLAGRRAARLEAQIAREPALAAALARQRAAIAATSEAAAVSAPASLRERVAAPPRTQAVRSRRGGLGLAAASLALAALVAVLVLPSGAPGGPTVVEAASLMARPATEPAPRPVAGKLLDRRESGVAFPNWSEKFGWRPAGARSDDLDGRRATTVFYTKGDQRIAYTIVGGAALDVPDGRDAVIEGTPVRLVRDDARTLVTWERGGHTCVLSGTAEAETLQELAGWKGKGSVPF